MGSRCNQTTAERMSRVQGKVKENDTLVTTSKLVLYNVFYSGFNVLG